MVITLDYTTPIPNNFNSLYFIGIGGAGMSGIAKIFLEKGYLVSGSDSTPTDATRSLKKMGVNLRIGHNADYLAKINPDVVVVTSAIWKDNLEYQFALKNKIPVLHRSQALKFLSEDKRTVAVAGSHGKTTSVGMLVTGLRILGENIGFVNGSKLINDESSAASGLSELFVIEADESDGSFLIYKKSAALITNINPDHLDRYLDLKDFHEAFFKFASTVNDLLVISADNIGTQEIIKRVGATKKNYVLLGNVTNRN